MSVYILAIIQFVVIFLISLYEVRLKSPTMFLWATLFIMFGVMHLYTSFSGDFEFSNKVLSDASIFVIFFCIFYIMVRVILVKLINKNRYKVLSSEILYNGCISEKININALVLILVFVTALKIIPFIQSSGGIFSTSWGSGRKFSSTLNYFNNRQIYSTIFFALSGISLYLFYQKKYTLTAVVLCIYLFDVILTRNRIEILPVFIFFISIYLLKLRKIKIRTIIVAGIMSVFVIYIVYGLRVYRHYGTLEVFLENFSLNEFIDKINLYLITDNGELGLRRDFYFFLNNNNQFENFNKGHSYIRMLFVFVPTKFSFGIKPQDFAHSMGAAIGMVTGGSTHPTLFGDCYANLNWAGCLLGVFWAMYASITDYIMLKNDRKLYVIMIYSLLAFGYVIIGRGSIYNGFVYVAYGIIIIFVFRYLNKNLIIKNKNILLKKHRH